MTHTKWETESTTRGNNPLVPTRKQSPESNRPLSRSSQKQYIPNPIQTKTPSSNKSKKALKQNKHKSQHTPMEPPIHQPTKPVIENMLSDTNIIWAKHSNSSTSRDHA